MDMDAHMDIEQIDTTIDNDEAEIEDEVDIINDSDNKSGSTSDMEANKADGEAVSISEAGALEKKVRSKRSDVWKEFTELIDSKGLKKAKCMHCCKLMSISKSSSTSHLRRHLKNCLQRKRRIKKQGLLNFQPCDSSVCAQVPSIAPAIVHGKCDAMRMREGLVHWVLMNEKPFAVVEEDGFNFSMNIGISQWEKISRVTLKSDCMKVYEFEKKRLKGVLKKIPKISLITDLWKSKSQNIGYMVVTAHFLDDSWKLNKRVLNFFHIPPPHRSVDISYALYKCVKEWGIENKVYSITVDNAKSNDGAISNLKEIFQVNRKLLCGGKLFHVRCCAHILNLIVQDGLNEIKHVIEDVRDSVHFINQSEARLKVFSDIVQQLQLPYRKLVLDCKTRWNSTYDMLACASKFKDVFPKYQQREINYDSCPSNEDWEKVDKILQILEVFANVTNIISGSEYPTSNLFLCEVFKVKQILYGRVNDDDTVVKDMVKSMKLKFDKYWGDCNLLMAIAAILDPRLKMMAVEYSFPKIYSASEMQVNIEKVRRALYELYNEYVSMQEDNQENDQCLPSSSHTSLPRHSHSSGSGFMEIQEFVRRNETNMSQKTDLDQYLSDGRHICLPESAHLFDILEWWKGNQSKYKVLSRMAADILAIPITSVASEATFSAGSRVIDSYRVSLSVDTVEALLCGGDWIRNIHGVKKKSKDGKIPKVVRLPIP